MNKDNWAFRKVGDKWQAELIDWEFFDKEIGYKYKDLPEPFEIDPNCDFVPPMMKEWALSPPKSKSVNMF